MPATNLTTRTALPEGQVLTVTQLNQRVQATLEPAFRDVWLQGEVSNFRRQSSGHCYASLKDDRSQVSIVIFKGSAAQQGVRWRDGMQVVIYGRLSVYEPRGAYQIVLQYAIEAGAGALHERLEALKRTLQGEGLFAAERKQPIPSCPRHLAIVTSPTGAALRDFISILRKYDWAGRLSLFPARVQGEEAVDDIVAAIKAATQWPGVEALIVARGGGSLEDLWSFNEERVVRAISQCPLPVISGVGHEIDTTLADLVADLRCETPTAAAEWITRQAQHYADRVDSLDTQLQRHMADTLHHYRQRLELARSYLQQHDPHALLERAAQRLDELAYRLDQSMRETLQQRRQSFLDAWHELKSKAPLAQVERSYTVLQQLERRLHSASPQSILQRGFVLLQDKKGRPLTRREQFKPGHRVRAYLQDGSLELDVPAEQLDLFDI